MRKIEKPPHVIDPVFSNYSHAFKIINFACFIITILVKHANRVVANLFINNYISYIIIYHNNHI